MSSPLSLHPRLVHGMGVEGPGAYEAAYLLVEDDNHFAFRLIRFHDAMSFANLVELKDARGLGLVFAFRDISGSALQRHIGKWEAGRSEHKASKKRPIDATRHLQERVQLPNRCEPAKPSRKAGPSASPQHSKRIKDRAVADQIEHRVDLLAFF